MKTSELGIKTKEIQDFEIYNKLIQPYVKKLHDVQNMIKHGVSDGRVILGKISLQSFQTEEFGSVLGKEAKFFSNSLEMEIKTTVSLELLRALEKYLIRKIQHFALTYGFEEDRFKPIFDECINIDKYVYGGWFD